MKLPTRSARAASSTRGKGFIYALGLLGLGAAVLLMFVGFNAPNAIPGRSYYNLSAAFKDADNLTGSYQVRIGGRLVGQVLRPRVENGKGVVDLQLTPEVEPLRSDSTIRVRPRSPVGVRFVELVPGTKGTPLREGGRIGSGQTSETVQLDEALGTLDASRREKAGTLINQLGVGLLSRGEDNNTTLRVAPGFLDKLESVSEAVNARSGAPQRFVAGSQGAANAADPVRDTIATGFKPGSEALDVFVRNGDALKDLLDVAPPTLSGVRTGLQRTDPFLGAAADFSREARPLLTSAVPALRQTAALMSEARKGLRDSKATLRLVDRAVPPTLRLLDTVRPVLPNADTVLRTSLPLLDEVAPRGCDLDLFFTNWESMLAYGNEGGSFLRLNVEIAPESLGGVDLTRNLGGVFSEPYPEPCQVGKKGVTR
ncbi:MAG: Long-chain-fatty-acid--CoA ligase [Solirubrobacterales bacterium]|jgi:ABC-type transporter Mla subunit MlaD|nr:Long-chain-fatty-acid--CoA ligase [Solirubrobacterales bacterium]